MKRSLIGKASFESFEKVQIYQKGETKEIFAKKNGSFDHAHVRSETGIYRGKNSVPMSKKNRKEKKRGNGAKNS